MPPWRRPALLRSSILGAIALVLACSGSSELVIPGPGSGDAGDASARGGSGGIVLTVPDGQVHESSTTGDGYSGPACGNGIREPGEGCDDGDPKPGDGCDGTCQVECGWACPTPGAPCVRQE